MAKKNDCIQSVLKRFWVKLILLIAPDIHTVVERQRLSIFVFTLLLLLFILPPHVAGLVGFQDPTIREVNVVWLALQFILVYCTRSKRMSITTALVTQLIIGQLRFSVTMLFCAWRNQPDDVNIIWIYLTFSMLVLLSSVLAHLRNVPSILAGITIVSYTAVIFLNDNPLFVSYGLIVVFIFFLSAVLGKRLLDGIDELQDENTQLRDEEQRIIGTMGLSKAEMLALSDVTSSPKDDPLLTGRFIGLLNKPSRQHLFTAVEKHVRIRETELALMERVFPELSESEREICRLILQGKKQIEVCAELRKSKGNITSQRTHIRSKLGLTPKDNLSDILHRRLEEYNLQAFRPKP